MEIDLDKNTQEYKSRNKCRAYNDVVHMTM